MTRPSISLRRSHIESTSFYNSVMAVLSRGRARVHKARKTMFLMISPPPASINVLLRSELVTFLISFRFWWPESSKEHRRTSILGVLRLRAKNPLLSDRSARRFAQDDGVVGVLKNLPVECAKNSKIKKVTTPQHSSNNQVTGRCEKIDLLEFLRFYFRSGAI